MGGERTRAGSTDCVSLERRRRGAFPPCISVSGAGEVFGSRRSPKRVELCPAGIPVPAQALEAARAAGEHLTLIRKSLRRPTRVRVPRRGAELAGRIRPPIRTQRELRYPQRPAAKAREHWGLAA